MARRLLGDWVALGATSPLKQHQQHHEQAPHSDMTRALPAPGMRSQPEVASAIVQAGRSEVSRQSRCLVILKRAGAIKCRAAART